ncbi:cupin domain-containing protein [Haloglomus litoreum]|uniref:cupin domain-containing protein n=1 Tax=Haloglomus litoreum TaxID=3034026 RepID=UPI0023E7B12B|nr:cupin domain-containing protein [Haloglomus sp. DT116]
MGYHVLDPDDLPRSPDHPCDRRSVSEAAELAQLALAVYTMQPGEQLPTTYHYHEQREEAFYVVSGRLAVETPQGEHTVEEGELFVAEPESPHRAYNPDDAEGEVQVVGMGAPKFDMAHPYEPDGG